MLTTLISMVMAIGVGWADGGNIRVNVSGNPGEIVLDGFLSGETAPALLEDVAIGMHHVELHYGCMSGEADVEVNPGQTSVVNLRMRTFQGTGTLRLRGLPSNGEVYMDGRPVDNPWDGFEADCGGREISVEAPGFEIWTTQVVVTRDKWSTVDVEMVQGEFDSADSVANRPPPGVDIQDDLADFDDDLEGLEPIEDDDFFGDDDPPPLDLSELDIIGALDDDEYEDLDEEDRAERNRRRLEEAERRERDGIEEWEPDNPSERELERSRQYEDEQRRRAAGLNDDYFDVESGRSEGSGALLSGTMGRVYIGSSAALLAGGATLAYLGHRKYQTMNNTYNIAFADDCSVNVTTGQSECSPEAVAYYDGFVWPQQRKRAAGIILGSVGLVGLGSSFFLVGDDGASGGDSVAERAARRTARREARDAREAEREASRSAPEVSAAYDDLDGDMDDGGRSARGARIGVLVGSAAVIGGGAGWGFYEHQQYQRFEQTYLTVWPECATQCVAEGVAYYDAYVWPHQVKRLVGFGISGAGLVGLGMGMLITSPTQVTLLPTMGGLEIGISGRF